MKHLIRLAVVALGLAFAAPGLAQAQDAACKQALVNLDDVKSGKSPPIGFEADAVTLKARGEGYKAPADAAAFMVDTYREHGDVRYLCPKKSWPAEVTDANLKKVITAALKADPKTYCGGGHNEKSVPAIIRGLLNTAGPDFFADRVLELQNQLDTTAGVKQQTAERHAADTEWLLQIITTIDDACPNGEAALDSGSAKIAARTAHDFAVENVAFVACVKARDGWQPQMKAFEEAAAKNDPAAMEAAYKQIETAAKPVAAACKASEEGSKENDYILASRRMRILFLTTPGCREASSKINDVRQSLNGMSKSSIPQAAGDLRRTAKEAGAACKDPAPETWGNFVAWVSEKNMWRLPDK